MVAPLGWITVLNNGFVFKIGGKMWTPPCGCSEINYAAKILDKWRYEGKRDTASLLRHDSFSYCSTLTNSAFIYKPSQPFLHSSRPLPFIVLVLFFVISFLCPYSSSIFVLFMICPGLTFILLTFPFQFRPFISSFPFHLPSQFFLLPLTVTLVLLTKEGEEKGAWTPSEESTCK